ncbi:MAG TPA: extracellular solute-binding protein, partial [bacterium]|nr:extracellular solute-binding protein [bacterium]
MKKISCLFFLILIFANIVNATNIKWQAPRRKANKSADPQAIKGGIVNLYGGQSPKSLNYYLDNNTFSAMIFGMLFDSLLNIDPITSEFTPGIADRWAVSDDGLTYYFMIDKNAKWSDGKSITAADVKFTFDTIMDPKNLTGPHKTGLEIFDPPIIIDTYTIKFTAKEKHWKNLLELSSLSILPEHNMKDKDFNKINFEFPVVSGPYRIQKINEGIMITLQRRRDWWQRNFADMKNIYNFEVINWRIVANPDDAFELFKKGQIDIYPVYTSRIWVNETTGDRFDKNWIVKQKVVNFNPIGFQGWAMNMRNEIFSDVRVRKALAHLINRKMMNEKLMFNQYFLHRSYFEDLYDGKKNICQNELIEFDIEKAKKLLDDADWKVDKTGRRMKGGKYLEFEFLIRDKSLEKFINIFAEDLKKVGINLKITLVDFAEWAKRMDTFKFDMTWASWSSGLFKDPESMWHSKEADRIQGNNITGFKNAKVDELIEKSR